MLIQTKLDPKHSCISYRILVVRYGKGAFIGRLWLVVSPTILSLLLKAIPNVIGSFKAFETFNWLA